MTWARGWGRILTACGAYKDTKPEGFIEHPQHTGRLVNTKDRVLASRAVWAAAALLVLAAVLPATLGSAWRVPVLALSLGVLPGFALARVLLPGYGRVVQFQIGIVLSPFIVGGSVAALTLNTGLSLASAARLVGYGIVAAAALQVFRPPTRGTSNAPVIAAPAVLWALFVLVMFSINPILAPRADGWFHSAVVLQIGGMGLPPEDPYFAGVPLLYFWGYHVWAAAWLALAPSHAVWTPLVTMSVLAAVAVMLGTCAIAARLGAGRAAQWWVSGATALGYAPFAWLILVARSSVGEVTGIEELRRMAADGATGLNFYMAGPMLDSSMVFFGDKFLVLTVFGLGLALVTSFVLVLHDVVRSGSWRSALALAALQSAGLFLHTFVAFVTGLVALAVWIALAIRLLMRRRVAVRGFLWLAVAVGGATLLMWPYLSVIVSGKRSLVPWGGSMRSVWTLVVGGWLLATAAVRWLWSHRAQRPGAAGLLLVVTVLAVLAVCIGLPATNQAKFFNILFLLLAAPAGMWLHATDARLDGARRVLFRTFLVAACVPTFLIATWAYGVDRAVNAWHEPSDAERAALDWISSHTPPSAVFVDPSGASDLIGLTGRSVIWGNEWGERDWGADPGALETRRRAARELASGRALTAQTDSLLHRLARPVYVVARPGPGDSSLVWNCFPDLGVFDSVFVNPEMIVYRYRAAPEKTSSSAHD